MDTGGIALGLLTNYITNFWGKPFEVLNIPAKRSQKRINEFATHFRFLVPGGGARIKRLPRLKLTDESIEAVGFSSHFLPHTLKNRNT